jgi:hypothetical protein
MAYSRTVLFTTLICSVLAACGGGGGSVAAGNTSTNLLTQTPAVSNFSSLTVPAGFTWTSQQSASASGITVTQLSGAVLGNVRVTVSNFIESDPTGSGATIAAMSTDVLTYTLGGSASGSSAPISFGRLILPSGTQQVLVEVFSVADGSRLGGGKFSVGSLLANNATLTF